MTPSFSAARSLYETEECFVSHSSFSRPVCRAAEEGRLRKLASRLYTWNLKDSVEAIIDRNLWSIVAGYFPGALIADRTALENMRAADGSICLVTKRGRDIQLPGLVLRPRRGVGPLDSDTPFVSGLTMSSPARAYLENMMASRSRDGMMARTLNQCQIEERLQILFRRGGEDACTRLLHAARANAPALGMEKEAVKLESLLRGVVSGAEPFAMSSRHGLLKADLAA